jgi:hypothetical protein
MKLSDYKSKVKQPDESKEKTSEPATTAAAPDKTTSRDPKYQRKVAVILVISHIFFAISITIWHLHLYILKPNGFGYIIYLLEIPGAIVMYLLGQTQNIESVIPYIAAFLINTIFYGIIGYFLGRIFQTYGWDKEIDLLWKLESEVYEESPEPKKP